MATSRPAPLPPEASAHALSPAALTAALKRPQAEPEVLREVLRRRPAGLRETLEQIVTDPARPAQLRTIATVGLSGLRDARSTPALLAAARSDDPALARRAFEALGRLGTPQTLAELKTLQAPAGPAARSLAFARSLIAYRHGLAGEKLSLPRLARITPMDDGRGQRLPVARLAARPWAALKPALEGADITLAPTERPPFEILCGRDRLLLLPNPALEGDSAAPALRRPLVAAVLMKHSPTLARWYVAEYVFAHPAPGMVATLIGVRPTGTVVHSGRIVAEAGTLRLELQALDSPLSAPMRASATLGTTAGVALQAHAEPDRSRQRNQARKPRPVAG
jgi:hypothetical protein